MNNPLISAAVEYVRFYFGEECSINSANPKDAKFDTLKNLMKRNIWLPDGAILFAWYKIKYCRADKEAVQSAREDLLEAFQRGAPCYSIGVKMLLNGLTLFANEAQLKNKKDAAIDKALNVILPLALHTSLHNPFTTVSFQFNAHNGP